MISPVAVASGGNTTFDLTPGAPSAQWQTGTTEPTLLRIRGFMVPFIQTATSASSGGVRESRFAAFLIYWSQDSTATLDPFISSTLSSEDILWHGMQCLDTRDFVVPAAATPANPFSVNIAGPGQNLVVVDVKAKRRVRSEKDRLILAVRYGEYFSQSTPPQPPSFINVAGLLGWSLRFLYRTHR